MACLLQLRSLQVQRESIRGGNEPFFPFSGDTLTRNYPLFTGCPLRLTLQVWQADETCKRKGEVNWVFSGHRFPVVVISPSCASMFTLTQLLAQEKTADDFQTFVTAYGWMKPEIQGGHPRILFRFENEIHKDFLLFLRILHFPASQRNRQLALFPELSSLLTHRAQQREGERSSVSEGRTITRKQESKRSVLGELAIWCSFAVPHLSTLVAWQKRDGTQNTPTRLYHPIGKGIFSHDELCTFLRSWMERDELDSLCQEGQSSVDPIAFSTISSSRQEWTRRQRVPPPLSPDLSNCSFDPPRSAFSRSLPGPKNSYPRGGQNLASQQRSSSSSSSLCMRGRMTFSDSDDASVGGRWQRQNESISQPSETVPHEWIRDLAKEILTWMSTSPPRRCNLFFWMTSHLSLSLTALLRYAFFYLFDADHSDKETMKTALYILFHATRAVDPDIQEILEQQDLPSPFAYPHFESWWKRARSFCCTRPTEERRESVPEPQ